MQGLSLGLHHNLFFQKVFQKILFPVSWIISFLKELRHSFQLISISISIARHKTFSICYEYSQSEAQSCISSTTSISGIVVPWRKACSRSTWKLINKRCQNIEQVNFRQKLDIWQILSENLSPLKVREKLLKCELKLTSKRARNCWEYWGRLRCHLRKKKHKKLSNIYQSKSPTKIINRNWYFSALIHQKSDVDQQLRFFHSLTLWNIFLFARLNVILRFSEAWLGLGKVKRWDGAWEIYWLFKWIQDQCQMGILDSFWLLSEFERTLKELKRRFRYLKCWRIVFRLISTFLCGIKMKIEIFVPPVMKKTWFRMIVTLLLSIKNKILRKKLNFFEKKLIFKQSLMSNLTEAFKVSFIQA